MGGKGEGATGTDAEELLADRIDEGMVAEPDDAPTVWEVAAAARRRRLAFTWPKFSLFFCL